MIFYTDPAQKDATERFITMLNASSKEGAPIVTEVLPLDVFYPAEDYHRDYVARNPQNSYCQVVINPKLQKVQETYADLLREVYRK